MNKCPKCGYDRISYTVIQDNAKTRQKNSGCLWAIGRWTLIILTCGLWLLVGKRKGTAKTTFNQKNMAVCQNCGYSWEI